jgi:single-strand DNA-binding protein
MSWHQTIIVGNLGGDPELKYLQSGTPVCNFSVAVTERWTTDDGKQEKTTWYRINAWGKLAEVCNQYLAKGQQVMVVGTVEARAYTTSNGEARASLDLRVRDVQFLQGGQQQGSRNGSDQHQQNMQQGSTDAQQTDDIPF